MVSEGEEASVDREEAPTCRLCERPVTIHRDDFEKFERMHWLCFHIVFEHEGDADEPCRDPSCPQWHLLVLRRELERLGHGPDEVIGEAIDVRYGL